MKGKFFVCFFLLAFSAAFPSFVCAAGKSAARPRPPLVGWLEKVRLEPGGQLVNATLMAGASVTSLHAEEITRFKRDGSRWVRFTVTDRSGAPSVIEREVLRIAKVQRQSGETEKRVVIEMGICIGSVLLQGPLQLTDRSDREFRMSVGRTLLAGNVVIDPGASYTVEPSCKQTEAK